MLLLGVGRLQLTVCHKFITGSTAVDWSSALSAQTDQCQFFPVSWSLATSNPFSWGSGDRLSVSINQSTSQLPVLVPSPVVVLFLKLPTSWPSISYHCLQDLCFARCSSIFLMAYWLASGWLKVSRNGFLREKDVLSLKVQHHNRNTQSHTMLHYTQSRLNISTPFAKGTVPLATHIERNLFPAVMSWKLHFFSLYSLWDCNKKILLPHRSPSLSGILPGPRKCSHGLTNRATAQKNSTHTSTAWLQIPEATALQEMHGCNWRKHMLPTAQTQRLRVQLFSLPIQGKRRGG